MRMYVEKLIPAQMNQNLVRFSGAVRHYWQKSQSGAPIERRICLGMLGNRHGIGRE